MQEKPEIVDIAICMGSSCFVRGNNRNLEAIQQFLKDNNLKERVRIKGSLCLGQCKRGPNILINGVLHSDIDPNTCVDLLQKYIS